MRPILLLILLLPSLAAQKSPNLWRQVNPRYNQPVLESLNTLPIARQLAVARLIQRCCASDLSVQSASTPSAIAQCLTFQQIPLAPNQDLMLVSGCWQGGTGGGGPMWLVRFRNGVPILLATSNNGFYGWLYSIQPTMTHGYHDLVLGWHMSAFETDLTYFQFNGSSYVPVGKAEDLCPTQDACAIHPVLVK
jgi:hypothetical protein